MEVVTTEELLALPFEFVSGEEVFNNDEAMATGTATAIIAGAAIAITGAAAITTGAAKARTAGLRLFSEVVFSAGVVRVV